MDAEVRTSLLNNSDKPPTGLAAPAHVALSRAAQALAEEVLPDVAVLPWRIYSGLMAPTAPANHTAESFTCENFQPVGVRT